MIIYPAIDIMEGRCVRLTRGDFASRKKYFDHPLEVAKMWVEKGAEWIHVIDLDGARTGKTSNLPAAADISQKTGVKVQYGGGIRDQKTIEEVLATGIQRAIIGTRALEDSRFLESIHERFKRNIMISLDYRKDGKIYKQGWQESISRDIFDLIGRLEGLGMDEAIITDIERDGTMAGADTGNLKKILESTTMKFIIAGGIAGIEDIMRLKRMEKYGVSGVIAGKALYEGSQPMDLAEAIRAGR